MSEISKLKDLNCYEPLNNDGGNLSIDVNKIAATAITELVTNFGSKIYTAVKTKYKDARAKEEIEFLGAFENYLTNACEKYGKTKTLLFKREPQNLYNFYQCIGVRDNNGRTISTSKIQNILDISHFIIITGTGGIGKTTLLKHFFLNSIDTLNHIPIFVELRNVNNTEISIEKYIYNSLTNLGFNLEYKYFEYSLDLGCYIFLFDGFDEINASKMHNVSDDIKRLTDKFPNNYYILSSRPTDAFIGWNRFIELEAMNLNKKQAISLITKINYNKVVKEKFLIELKNGLFEKHRSFASNPLLLTIMLLTYEDHASIPDKLHVFYEQAFITLFNKHDFTKDGYQRDIHCSLTYDEFKAVFSCFCFKSFFHNEYEFSETKLLNYINNNKKVCTKDFDATSYKLDLTNSVCMMVQDGFIYSFTHRSFQEYFAALYTTKLSDTEQSALLIPWVKNVNSDFGSGYLQILSDLEERRFNKVLILPLLTDLKKEYERKTFPKEWILESQFSNYLFDFYQSEENDENVGISCVVRKTWISSLLDFIKINYNFQYAPLDDDKLIDKRVVEYFSTRYDINTYFSLDELKEMDIFPDLLLYLRWNSCLFEFSMEVLEELIMTLSVNPESNLSELIDQF